MTGDQCLQEATALLKQKRAVAAEQVLAAAPAKVAALPAWSLLRGIAHTRLGRIDSACALLAPLIDGAEPWATEACAALADAYHFAHRHEDLRQLLARGKPWAQTPRGKLFAARLLVKPDPEQALAMLREVVAAAPTTDLKRIAGFDAVKQLDRMARYREAFELATQMHAMTPAFDLNGFLAGVQLQQRLLSKGSSWCQARVEPVRNTAFVAGLPRSGTTLLEQMLDCHVSITGIGEHEGIGDLSAALISAGVWPYRLKHLPPEAAATLQQQYRRSARQGIADEAVTTLDKSLLTWRCLPALAAVLPGARCLHVQRDARDMAVSAFLSYFDPQAFGWTSSIESILQVVAAERALVPLALETLQIPHEVLAYEDLVARPREVLHRCLRLLELPMDEAVLKPEQNRRTAVTLSHEQVRQPVNDASIGRWRHYDFAF
ncbi:MAG TPA: sulfotransferase [Burkholderiaceae bacterium]